jgi:hypothetical protein
MCLLVYRRTGLVVFKTAPWSGRISLSARDGPSVPKERKTQRARLSRLLHWDQRHLSSSEAAEPRGAREAICRHRLPCVSMRHRILCCEYSESTILKNRHRPQCVCGSEVRSESRLRGSQASLNSNCQKTGESNFISNDAAHRMQGRRQRFPTVRTVGWLGNSEVRAKMNNIRACTSTVR